MDQDKKRKKERERESFDITALHIVFYLLHLREIVKKMNP